MHRRRSLPYLLLIISIVIAPTAVSLTWYNFTLDPYLRPLGITQQAIRAYQSGGKELQIVALVDWVPSKTGNNFRSRLSEALYQSFSAKGADVRVVFREGKGATRVTYRIGNSVVGPFSTARAAEGVNAAIQAYRMHGARSVR